MYNIYRITTLRGVKYSCKTLIFATDISLKNIKLINFELPEIINYIAGTSYVRMYTKHANHNIKSSLIGNNALRKIIPINDNILMSAYTEFIFADKLKEAIDKSVNKIETINSLIKEFLNKKYQATPIQNESDYLFKYWKTGAHYYKPNYDYKKTYYIDRATNFIICGEMISHHQGYVEGGISSVDDCIAELWK
jgi:hypothetical protein